MSLLFMDGFDSYPNEITTNIWSSPYSKWSNGFESLRGKIYGAQNGRFNDSKSLLINSGSYSDGAAYIYKNLNINANTLIVGMAFKTDWTLDSGRSVRIFGLADVTSVQMGVNLTYENKIFITRGGAINSFGTTIASTNVPLLINTWNYIEFKVTFDSINGSYQLKLNGKNLLLNNGPVATVTTSNNYANRLLLSGVSSYGGLVDYSAPNFFFDDLYVCDDQGSTNNSFLGECRIQTSLPSADHSVDFTPSSGSNFEAVNELVANTSDYVTSNTPGDIDLYDVDDLNVIPDTVYAIQTNVVAKKDNVATRTIKPVILSNVTTVEGSEYSLLTEYTSTSMILEQDPDVNDSWTEESINALKIGFKIEQ